MVIDNNDCKLTKQKSSLLPRYFNLFEQSFYFSRIAVFIRQLMGAKNILR